MACGTRCSGKGTVKWGSYSWSSAKRKSVLEGSKFVKIVTAEDGVIRLRVHNPVLFVPEESQEFGLLAKIRLPLHRA